MFKKGQSALEFVILVSFTLIIVSSLLIVFNHNVEEAEKVRRESLVNQMLNLVSSEIEFAIISKPIYNRTFFLPSELGGYPYSINIYDYSEIVLDYRGKEYVLFLTNGTLVNGTFSGPGGINFISKKCVDCIIQINDGTPIPLPVLNILHIRGFVNNEEKILKVRYSGIINGTSYNTKENKTYFNITSEGNISLKLTAFPNTAAAGLPSSGGQNKSFIKWIGCDSIDSSNSRICIINLSNNEEKTIKVYYGDIDEFNILNVSSIIEGSFFTGVNISYEIDSESYYNYTNFFIKKSDDINIILTAPLFYVNSGLFYEFENWENCENQNINVCEFIVSGFVSENIFAVYKSVSPHTLNIRSKNENSGEFFEGVPVRYNGTLNNVYVNLMNNTFFSLNYLNDVNLMLTVPLLWNNYLFVEWENCENQNNNVCVLSLNNDDSEVVAVYESISLLKVFSKINNNFFEGLSISYSGNFDGTNETNF